MGLDRPIQKMSIMRQGFFLAQDSYGGYRFYNIDSQSGKLEYL